MQRRPTPARRPTALIVLVVAAVITFLLGPSLLGFYVDWLWFGEARQRGTFWTLLTTRLLLGLVFGAALATLILVNLAIARRLRPRYTPRMDTPEWVRTAGRVAREGVTGLLLLGGVALGVMGGLVAAARWDDWLRFVNPQTFGIQDPVFGLDVGFFIFRFPFLRFINGWVFTALLLAALVTAAVYYLDGAISLAQGEARIASTVRAHLSVLLGLAMLAKAWDYRLDQYALLLEPRTVLFGAGFTEVHARIPALNILMVVAIVAALGFFWNARARALLLPAGALALMVVAGITVGGIYPALVQRFQVVPNQQAQERRFITHHLNLTRAGYGLDRITPSNYQLGQSLRPADLTSEQATLENIRLWDYQLLGRAYQQVQHLRNYYDLRDVDIDRYMLNGRYRQVMLSPRELVTERLEPQQQTWVNQVLQYTHGYGLVMSRVNEVDSSGRPMWVVRDLPLKTSEGLKITRPEIYYGISNDRPVITPSNTPEIDYPLQNGNATSSYGGGSGIPVGSPWMRWVFSLHQGDWNILISDQIRRDSRILIRRTIPDRIHALAPFLHLDRDPYLVVLEGRLIWVQDAYTSASTFPYSAPTAFVGSASQTGVPGDVVDRFNYIRNSVKATVDAYTGEVRLYVADEGDPVLRAYRRAFPGLLWPAAEMPAGLRAHLRYPEDLFNVQAQKLLRYHVTNPDVFYQGSDTWELTTERRREGRRGEDIPSRAMEPYYVVMRLPGETRDEFVLFLPFKPRGGTTMTGWLAARCDGDRLGELRLYRFPAESQVDTPEQVDNSIRADPIITEQIALLVQGGSGVLYGNFLVLPVGQSLLYVKPLFVEAARQGTQEGIPELKRVILAERRGGQLKVVMKPTLREALAALAGAEVPGDAPPPAPGEGAVPPPAGTAPDTAGRLAAEAESAFQAADAALRRGDWTEYGRQMQRAREAIRRLRPLLR